MTGGSAPAIISGPRWGAAAVAIVAGLLLARGAWANGLARCLMLLLWAVLLAAATHRLVEWTDGAVAD